MGTGCASCGHISRPGVRFCTGCGASLPTACPACGETAYPGERFCGACGSPLTAGGPPPPVPAPPPAEGERKQVTVLFADVANSMGLAERLDADQLTEVMQGLFDLCRTAVEAFGGTVDKFTGDGVMALFGAPVAQEDHARRAAHAGLRLLVDAARYADGLRARGLDLAVRVGLNSGEVVAGSVGEAFTAVGHTVGLAQRMESAAEAGTVCVSEHTAALLGEEFRLEDRGPTPVKGVSAPVRVYVLRGATSASVAARRRAGSTTLVGRDVELSGLEAALAAARDGRAQVVGIVGEAGAGKSRLCEELARTAAEAGVIVRRTAGVSHAQSAPLLPILGFLREYFGVASEDSAAEVRVKVRETWARLGMGADDDVALLCDFMEVPDPQNPPPSLSPEARRRRVLDMFRRATTRRSEQQTMLLLLEDLHWFDQHSVAFLSDWLPSFPGTRTLVVTNFRPEFHAPWMGSSYYRQIPLTPLDGIAVRTLLDEMLGRDPSLAVLIDEI